MTQAKKEKIDQPIQDELNAFNLRKNFSSEDLNHLIQSMDNMISEYKAEQKGFDPENMVKTVRGGKTVWITKAEMNAIFSKRHRFFSREKQKHVESGVQESSESFRRMRICQMFIDVLRSVSAADSLPFSKLKRSMDAVMNQSNSQAKEFRMMEEALRRKKEDGPIYRQMRQANERMIEAIETNNLDDAELCQTFSNHHMEEYEIIQKRIESYEQKMNLYKDQYVGSKQKVYCLQFEFIKRGALAFVAPVKELLYHDNEKKLSHKAVECLKTWQSNIKKKHAMILTLHQSDLEELKSNPAQFSKVDQGVMELFDDMLLFLESFRYAWDQCVLNQPEKPAKRTEPSPVNKGPSPNRMAYPSKSSHP